MQTSSNISFDQISHYCNILVKIQPRTFLIFFFKSSQYNRDFYDIHIFMWYQQIHYNDSYQVFESFLRNAKSIVKHQCSIHYKRCQVLADTQCEGLLINDAGNKNRNLILHVFFQYNMLETVVVVVFYCLITLFFILK